MERIDQKQVAENVRLMKAQILSDPENASIFRAKMVECSRLMPVLDKLTEDFTKHFVDEPNPPDGYPIIAEYFMEKHQKMQSENRRQYKAFKWYKHLCEGKAKMFELNIEQAKQFLIGDILNAEVKQKTRGRSWYRCPLHEETTASFVHYTEQNTWHCYGCSQGGDSIDLIMKMQKISFQEAVKKLT